MKKILYFIVIIMITGCGVASFYRKGVDLFQKHQYSEAIKWFELSLEKQEKKPLTTYFLAVSHENIKQHERAVYYFNKILNEWQENVELEKETVEQLLKRSKINLAIETGVKGEISSATETLIELTGSEYKFYLSEIYLKRKEYGTAIQTLYNAFIMQNEQSDTSFISRLWYKIGCIYFDKYKEENTEGDFFNSCFALRMAVIMKHPSENFQNIIESKYAAVQEDPLFEKYKPVVDSYRKIYKYKELDDYDKIIAEAHRIVEISPVEDDIYIALNYSGKAHYEKKEYAKALDELKRVKDFTEKKLYLTSADIYDLLEEIYSKYNEIEGKGE